MRGRLVLPLLLGASAIPDRAAAQSPAYAANASDLDSATQSVLRLEISRAASRGVPEEPLLAKVREGRLKRASGIRIRAAVAALAVRLDSARAGLGPGASRDELVAGADAIAAGAAPSTLRALRIAAGGRPLGTPLGALAQLVASGVAPRRAEELILELLRRNVAPARVLAYGAAVEADVGGGVPAEESAVFRMHALKGFSGADATVLSPAVTTQSPKPTGGGIQGSTRRRP